MQKGGCPPHLIHLFLFFVSVRTLLLTQEKILNYKEFSSSLLILGTTPTPPSPLHAFCCTDGRQIHNNTLLLETYFPKDLASPNVGFAIRARLNRTNLIIAKQN